MNEVLPRIDSRGRRVGGQPSVIRVFNRKVSIVPSDSIRVRTGGGVPARVVLNDAKMQKGGLVRVVEAKPLAERLAEKAALAKKGEEPMATVKVEELKEEPKLPPQKVVDEPSMPMPAPMSETEERLTDLLEVAQEVKPQADAAQAAESAEGENVVIIPELPEKPEVEEAVGEEPKGWSPPEQPTSFKKKRKKNRRNRHSMMAAEGDLAVLGG